jgi:hypothetical protein
MVANLSFVKDFRIGFPGSEKMVGELLLPK